MKQISGDVQRSTQSNIRESHQNKDRESILELQLINWTINHKDMQWNNLTN